MIGLGVSAAIAETERRFGWLTSLFKNVFLGDSAGQAPQVDSAEGIKTVVPDQEVPTANIVEPTSEESESEQQPDSSQEAAELEASQPLNLEFESSIKRFPSHPDQSDYKTESDLRKRIDMDAPMGIGRETITAIGSEYPIMFLDHDLRPVKGEPDKFIAIRSYFNDNGGLLTVRQSEKLSEGNRRLDLSTRGFMFAGVVEVREQTPEGTRTITIEMYEPVLEVKIPDDTIREEIKSGASLSQIFYNAGIYVQNVLNDFSTNDLPFAVAVDGVIGHFYENVLDDMTKKVISDDAKVMLFSSNPDPLSVPGGYISLITGDEISLVQRDDGNGEWSSGAFDPTAFVIDPKSSSASAPLVIDEERSYDIDPTIVLDSEDNNYSYTFSEVLREKSLIIPIRRIHKEAVLQQ